MNQITLAASVLSLSLVLGGCGLIDHARHSNHAEHHKTVAAPGLQDGELAVPANYRDWPVFLADIDKVEAKQIRDIYISHVGHMAKAGEAFPDGTISVMEIWNPQMTASGELKMDADGKLVKADLKAIYVMGKSAGAGEMVPENLRNGDWVYSAYQADGVTSTGSDATACRACHTPQADKDWVHRYDEYFANRNH